MKVCIRCKINQEESCFGKNSRYKSGVYPYCKTCIRAENKKSYEANKKDRVAKAKLHRQEHPEKCKASKKKSYFKNKPTVNKKNSEWQKNNRQKINSRRYERYPNDPAYRVGNLLRSRLAHLLLNGTKTGKLAEYLGCSLLEFRHHLEKQFLEGMTWGNHGKGEGKWNMDHIIPLCSGQTPEEVTALNHFTNIRPLWEKDNTTKSAADKLYVHNGSFVKSITFSAL